MKKIFKEEEEEIIRYITNNVENCLELGIVKVAKLNYISSSALVRLAKKMGYKGYTEMLYSLKKDIEIKSEFKINFKTKYKIRKKEEIKIFLNSLTSKNIIIYGEGFSGIVATYFNKRLLTLGITSQILDCIDFGLYFNEVTLKNGVIILISNTGESEKCLEIIKEIQKSKFKYNIISFTGKDKNSIEKNSNAAFIIEGISTENLIVRHPTPFYGNVILGFEELLNLYLNEQIKKGKKYSVRGNYDF